MLTSLPRIGSESRCGLSSRDLVLPVTSARRGGVLLQTISLKLDRLLTLTAAVTVGSGILGLDCISVKAGKYDFGLDPELTIK